MSGDTITCVDCGQSFLWSFGEQRFYKEHNLDPPKRCSDCRAHNRVERDSGMRSVVGPPSEPPTSAERRWTEAAGMVQQPTARTAPPPTTRKVAAPASQRPRNAGLSRSYRQRRASWWSNPVHRHGAISFGLAIALTIILRGMGVTHDIVLSWLIAINTVTLVAYVYDKAIAGSDWTRVPERVLLLLTFAGGTIGAVVGMQLSHHKTAKTNFLVKFWFVVVAQVALVAAYYLLIVRRS